MELRIFCIKPPIWLDKQEGTCSSIVLNIKICNTDNYYDDDDNEDNCHNMNKDKDYHCRKRESK